ncbi:MAG: DUF1905 domain-containing protein [Pedobacter sp.]|nr:MAG: DUF1905 domain-containing protein [Pedobacter sp.]
MEQPIIDQVILLKKFPGKGGWTYAHIPGLSSKKGETFGMTKLKCIIDEHEIATLSLMPLGNGELFFPVKAEIRKTIGKEAGNSVRIRLYALEKEFNIKEEFMICLADEPDAERNYQSLSDTDQQKYLQWIAEASSTDSRIERIADAVTRIACRQKVQF